VNQEYTTAFEPHNQILAAPVERYDPLSLELGGHFGGVEGPGETTVVDLDSLQPSTDELRFQPCSDGLDLRKLRHAPKGSQALRRRAAWP
jgi:hypothetical protein